MMMPETVAQVVVMLLVIICEIFANYQLPISNYLALFRGKQGDLLPGKHGSELMVIVTQHS